MLEPDRDIPVFDDAPPPLTELEREELLGKPRRKEVPAAHPLVAPTLVPPRPLPPVSRPMEPDSGPAFETNPGLGDLGEGLVVMGVQGGGPALAVRPEDLLPRAAEPQPSAIPRPFRLNKGAEWVADAMAALGDIFGLSPEEVNPVPVLVAAPVNHAVQAATTLEEAIAAGQADKTQYHPPAEILATMSSGALYDHYCQFLPWLQPIEPERAEVTEDGAALSSDPTACRPPWKAVSTKWGPWDTSRLWSIWGQLLPLFLDPTVEEIFVQKILNGPNTTPPGVLAVLSDGAMGLRLHPALFMTEAKLIQGFGIVLNAKDKQLYREGTPDGTARVESPLDLDGSRLTGGVPPASVGAFCAIRIPPRVRPDMPVVAGAAKFGAEIWPNLVAPGIPVRPPVNTLLAECKKFVDEKGVHYDTMLPIEALEYIECSYKTGKNVIYVGATSAAKTTILNAGCRLMPLHWRVCSVETGVAELYLPHENWVPLFVNPQVGRTKEGNMDDALDEAGVIRLAMRMSPKTIPVGEVRSNLDIGLYAALCMTGHEASPCTIHAGSPDEALMRFTQGIMGYAGATGASLTENTARGIAASVCNVVVQLRRDEYRDEDGSVKSIRRATEIVEVHVDGTFIEGNQSIRIVPIFKSEVDPATLKPILTYTFPDHCSMWDAMRDRYLEAQIPAWANYRPERRKAPADQG